MAVDSLGKNSIGRHYTKARLTYILYNAYQNWLMIMQIRKPVVLDLLISLSLPLSLREKCPDTELFLVRIPVLELKCKPPYSVRIQENRDQKKLCSCTLFTQCI